MVAVSFDRLASSAESGDAGEPDHQPASVLDARVNSPLVLSVYP
jgi:hypothetical protein